MVKVPRKEIRELERNINGKRYIGWGTEDYKSDAGKRAKGYRSKGVNARVFKGKYKSHMDKRSRTVYRIYIHDPNEKMVRGEKWFYK